MAEILEQKIKLRQIKVDKSWSFSDCTQSHTGYVTHSYYTYPAKFIPQLAARLIKENSNESDVVIDPFMGSGTTIVEAILNNRKAIGVDINNIAHLISKVKTTPLNSKMLQDEFSRMYFDIENRVNGQIDLFLEAALKKIPKNERIDYWFKKDEKEKLSIIFKRLLEINNKDLRDFFFVAFAQILKSSSIWLQKSVKPTRDLNKKIQSPISLFYKQVKKMIKKNSEFDKLLPDNTKINIDEFRIVKCDDARNLPCENQSASLIVTSPPYVTSYEYADLHQLPSLWFSYFEQLPEFRKKFIGSAYNERKEIDLRSTIAEEIVNKLGDNKKGKEVKNYFADMLESFLEMKRVLKKGGRSCIVIGNTKFQGVEILNAEVFREQFENIGFKTHNIIHREIPSKMLPSTRDTKTGQFVKVSDKNLIYAYPTEYILIMEKL